MSMPHSVIAVPSRRLHLLAWLARWALRGVVAAWCIFLLVWVGLHVWIVPRIPQWGGHVQQWASQALGAQVRIGSIEAQARGLFPTVQLRDVRVLDSQDSQAHPALELPLVVLTVSPRSILRGGLEQLFIDAPHLEVRRLADGRWRVAGLTITPGGGDNPQAAQWLLDQPELAVQGGHITWVDEVMQDSRQLHDVRLVLRSNHWRNALRLDAQDDQGQQLHAAGLFRRPLLPGSAPLWQRWSGQWFAQLHVRQLPPLPWPADSPVAALQGQGQLRLWADVHEGQMAGITTDVALRQAQVQWQDSQRPALALEQVQGRVSAQWHDSASRRAWSAQVQQLRFDWRSPAGAVQHWPASDWSAESATQGGQEHLRIQLAQADVGLASQLLGHLPIPAALEAARTRWAPTGELHNVQLRVSPGKVLRYTASGQLRKLALRSQDAPAGTTAIGTPGFSGLDADFSATEHGGSAQVRMQQGTLSFPGVFEEPTIAIDQLSSTLRWAQRQGRWQVDVQDTHFANADAAGQFQAHWHMGTEPEHQLPGVLDLQGQLTRADGTRVHRYLPLDIPAQARHYVRDSILAGGSRNVRFAVQGDLRHMPFHHPDTGRFYIAADITGARYDYVPASLRPAGQAAWPVLDGLSGQLIFDGPGIQVRAARTSFVGQPQLHLGHIEADIADLNTPVVHVRVHDQAPLDALLHTVRGTALEQLTGGALSQAQAQGPAQLQLALELPIDTIEHSRVSGQIQLQRNTLQLWPMAPPAAPGAGARAL